MKRFNPFRSPFEPAVTHASASERIRDLFNARAKSWSNHYRPGGKLNWRLRQFCAAIEEASFPSARVLDFGCGTGQLAMHLHERHYVLTGCDMADQMIATARLNFGDSGINWISLSAHWRRLPFADRIFDAVVASSVLEYVDDMESVLGELARVLRDGGVLIFNVPNPSHARRKREHWASRVTSHRWIRRTVCTVPRVLRFLTYLGLSKNRFPLGEWETMAGRHGFHRLPLVSDRNEGHPMFLFVFKQQKQSHELAVSTTICTGPDAALPYLPKAATR